MALILCRDGLFPWRPPYLLRPYSRLLCLQGIAEVYLALPALALGADVDVGAVAAALHSGARVRRETSSRVAARRPLRVMAVLCRPGGNVRPS